MLRVMSLLTTVCAAAAIQPQMMKIAPDSEWEADHA
jgi:hypothetical protein